MSHPALKSLYVALSLLAGAASAADPVTIAYQTGIDPSKVAQADGAYEAATGSKINWRKFESGAEVIAAVASGDVPIGNIGSSPLAAAASRGLPIQTFLVTAEIGDSEALVVRNGSNITAPKDLVGKKVAVPFVSTTHYSLLAALKHWGVDASKVNIVNLRPSEIAAAWQRGDIDAAYVWEPALGTAKASGKVLVSSAQVASGARPLTTCGLCARTLPRSIRSFSPSLSKSPAPPTPSTTPTRRAMPPTAPMWTKSPA